MSLKKIKLIVEKHSEEDVEKAKEEHYGQEAIFDIHNVASDKYDVKSIGEFAKKLAQEIGMKTGPSYHWGTKGEFNSEPDLPVKADGISHVQFIYESSITIHALDKISKVYVNIFSCKDFDAEKAKEFTMDWFGGDLVKFRNIVRE